MFKKEGVARKRWVGALLALSPVAAFAQTGGALSGLTSIWSNVDQASVIAGILAAAAILAAVNFAGFGVKRATRIIK